MLAYQRGAFVWSAANDATTSTGRSITISETTSTAIATSQRMLPTKVRTHSTQDRLRPHTDDMADASRKTTPTEADVEEFLSSVANERRREDARAALELIRDVTGVEPVLWGSSIIGFGRQPYTGSDGKQREWFAVGLAPRQASLTLYGLTFYGSNEDLLQRLGPHTTGKGCVYVKRLDALDRAVLVELVQRAWAANHVA